MKRINFLFMLMFLCLSFVRAQEITILHTNDLHSHLNGDAPSYKYSPLTVNDDATTGGFSRIATIIKETKANTDHPVLTLDAGDFLMGTFFHTLEKETGFQLNLMHKMGYDFVALGNHEFDFGPSSLSKTINASANRGDIPKLLLSNAKFHKSSEDDGLENLYDKGIISNYAIKDIQGIRIGLFSLMGIDADHVAPNASPVKFTGQIRKAKQLSKFLKRKKRCDLVICLSHSGLFLNDAHEWEGEDIDLAEKVRDIDIVIGGHTHTPIVTPIIANGIPVVQAGSLGKRIGKIILEKEGQTWLIKDYDLVLVGDHIKGDAEIQQLIDHQQQAVKTKFQSTFTADLLEPIIQFPFDMNFEEYGDPSKSNLGPLVADAIHHYCTLTPQGADIAIIAAGMIRSQYKAGMHSTDDIFRCVSLGNGNDGMPGYPLSRLYVSGKELKGVMEVLRMAHKSSNANYIYFSGVSANVDPSKGFLNKIQDITITGKNGKSHKVSFSKKDTMLYSLVADSYMLQFIGLLKNMTFGLVNVKPKHMDGSQVVNMDECIIDMDLNTEGIQEGKQWLAMLSLFHFFNETSSELPTKLPEKYRNPQQVFTTKE